MFAYLPIFEIISMYWSLLVAIQTEKMKDKCLDEDEKEFDIVLNVT